MSGIGSSRAVVLAALAALVLLGACGSSAAARFYTLTPEDAPPGRAAGGETVVAVGPVSVPEYLDRPQIATRTSGNEIALAEYDRWAGSFGENVETVLTENLAATLRGPGATVIRWSAAGQVPVRCRVVVDVLRFEAGADGVVTLKAQWTISQPGTGKAAYVGETSVKEAAAGKGYADIAAAMSRALVVLGKDVATVIVSRGYSQ